MLITSLKYAPPSTFRIVRSRGYSIEHTAVSPGSRLMTRRKVVLMRRNFTQEHDHETQLILKEQQSSSRRASVHHGCTALGMQTAASRSATPCRWFDAKNVKSTEA